MSKDIKKRIPMTKEFNKKSVNDWLYGYLQSISYVDNEGRTFVYKDDVNISSIFSNFPSSEFGESPSRQKLSRDFNILKRVGFLKETKVQGLQGNFVKAYELPYDKQQLYKLIPIDTLIYILSVGSQNLLKIYVYLLSKYQWKIANNDYYRFTYKELIKECLGMKSVTNSRDYTIVRNCLDALIKFKLIELSLDYDRVGQNQQLTTYFKLSNVNTTIKYESVLNRR